MSPLLSKLLLSILLCAGVGALQSAKPLYWFATKSTNNTKVDDFRGCYDQTCAYVATEALSNFDKAFAPYVPSQKLWAVADSKNENISWIFSQKRPTETSTTLWITPVADHHVISSKFNATPYIKTVPDPLVARFVASISQERIKSRVEQLSNEFFTRNSLSSDAVKAASYLEGQMKEIGCQSTKLHNFMSGYSPNVLCELLGFDVTASAVVVGAHYDSRARLVSDPTLRAPGADDNASGTAGVLDILTTAVELMRSGVLTFRRKLIFALFSGEEQGLYGSNVLADEMKRANVELAGMINLDMIGYPQRDAPTTLFWKSTGTNQNLTNLGITLARTYLGEDTIIALSSSCCSDQQSFHAQGYAAAGVFESKAATNNPNYHMSSDLPNTVTYSHVLKNVQSAAALIATIAEPHIPTQKDNQSIDRKN